MRVVRCSFALVLFALLLLAPRPALAQPEPQPEPKPILVPGGGTEVFRSLLNYLKIKPVTERELRRADRSDDLIVIIFGSPSAQATLRYWPPNNASIAVQSGGAAFYLMDTQMTIASTSNSNLSIADAIVTCDEEKSIHDGRPTCPYLVPLETKNPRMHEIFHGLKRIATNRPSYLTVERLDGSFQSHLATFPPNSKVNGVHANFWPNSSFAVGGEGPDAFYRVPYQFLAIADHSIFINQMLLEPDTDNLELAYRTIEFLQGPNKRSRCAFFENGVLIDHFDDLGQAAAKQNPMPMPRIDMGAMQEWLVTQGNRLIDGAQNDNVVNRALDRLFGVPSIARFFLLVLTVMACGFLLRRAWSSRKPSDAPPSPAIAGAPTGPPGVFERRQKELLRRNNVYEPIRDLLRDFFLATGIHGEQGRRHPKIVVSDVVRKPDSLRAAVKDMWKIAFGPPETITVSRLRELEPFFERLRSAHADGKWYFVLSESTAGSVE